MNLIQWYNGLQIKMNHEDEENIEPWENNTTTIHFNGYSFTKNNVYKNYVNYRCSAYRSGCTATLKKNTGEIEQKEKKVKMLQLICLKHRDTVRS